MESAGRPAPAGSAGQAVRQALVVAPCTGEHHRPKRLTDQSPFNWVGDAGSWNAAGWAPAPAARWILPGLGHYHESVHVPSAL